MNNNCNQHLGGSLCLFKDQEVRQATAHEELLAIAAVVTSGPDVSGGVVFDRLESKYSTLSEPAD